MRWCALLAAAVLSVPIGVRAQSTLATLSGTVYDEQRAIVSGASITLKSLETGQERRATSDGTGNFRISGLTPGRYEMSVASEGFVTDVQPDLQLSISAEAERDVNLTIASVMQHVTVTAAAPLPPTSKTTLGRTFETKEIDELPVVARDFANLAQLTPGILTNAANSDIVAAGLIGRNNTFLVDGLSLDEHLSSERRGGVSLDTVKEFAVLSNGFTAEYGHAAGAVVSVLTRSGTNQFSGRAFYYRRDDAWNANSAAAQLTVPPAEKTKLEQQTLGGFFGGPAVLNRAFFFGSMEHMRRESENIVTSSVLHAFLPDAPTHLPVHQRNPKIFARGDVVAGTRNTLIPRARLDRNTLTNLSLEGGLSAPERHFDLTTTDRDLAVLDNHVLGPRGFNEFRFQYAQRSAESDVDAYCPACLTLNFPTLFLGKSDLVPEHRTERRWQFANAFTYLVSDRLGDHAFRAGIDASSINIRGFQPAGFDGTFTFRVDRPFDPADDSTYPRRYRRNSGDPFYDLSTRVYAAFFQDQWKPTPRLTVNLGVRWDYEDGIRVARDADNIAPRVGLAFDPWRDGRTAIRGSYGVFYDAVLFQALVNSFRGSQVFRTQINEPGYPDPFGPNPNRTGSVVVAAPNGRRFADSIRTPYTEQASAGLRHVHGPLSMTADAVWARGRNLMRLRDANYPDLDDPRRLRPDPNFQEVTIRETEGRSVYRALQIGIQKRHSRRHSYGIAYTLSRSDRDTEDWDFVPQDQRDYGADWGPSSSDARHRLAASAHIDLPRRLRLTTIVTARSGLPYNVTTGNNDPNRDGYFTDRPPGVGRNSRRGDDFRQLDVRLTRTFGFGARRVDLIVEAFNAANRKNWIAYDGVQPSATFGKPSDAANPRELQIGVRVDF